jgi:hypothetical protein
MYTKLLKIMVNFKRQMSGHCGGSPGGSGHCS